MSWVYTVFCATPSMLDPLPDFKALHALLTPSDRFLTPQVLQKEHL